MVECEYGFLPWNQVVPDGFNRYMVECECVLISRTMSVALSFNRYMVECECFAEDIRKDF